MPSPTKGPRLGSGPAHERLLLAGLASALFERGRIVTTETKAKRLRPLAERLITFAKRGDLHARRQVLAVIPTKAVVHRLFADIGPAFADRAGGYTRITKIGPRHGDGAPMAVVELVEGRTATQEVVAEAERARGTRFRRRGGAARAGAAEVPAEADVDVAAPAEPVEQVAVPTEGGDTEVAVETDTADQAEVDEATDAAVDTGAAAEVAVEPAGAGAVADAAADEPPAEPAP